MRTRNVAVGTTKKSIAAMPSRWFRRKVFQLSAEPGGAGRLGIHLEMVRSETTNPSLSSSPWIRGAPQPFSLAMRRTRSRISRSSLGRPGRRLLDFHRQYVLKPRRCHRTTVSGRTRISASRHRGHVLRRKTQKARSAFVSLGRDFLIFIAASCWRRALFSITRSARERNADRTAGRIAVMRRRIGAN